MNKIRKYHRQDLLHLAHEMGIHIKSDEDLMQFEYEMVVTGHLDESVLNEPVDAVVNNVDSTDIKLILELVRKLDKSINVEASEYKSKKELLSAKAQVDIKMDTIKNKRK